MEIRLLRYKILGNDDISIAIEILIEMGLARRKEMLPRNLSYIHFQNMLLVHSMHLINHSKSLIEISTLYLICIFFIYSCDKKVQQTLNRPFFSARTANLFFMTPAPRRILMRYLAARRWFLLFLYAVVNREDAHRFS
jgi:hypothetical protein